MTDSEKLDLLLTDMAAMKQDMSGMKQDMAGVKQDMAGMEQAMKQEMAAMKQDMAGMKQDLEQLTRKVSGIELILENEIRVNIMRVAEGHLDLSRNLHEAMKPSQEVEMLALKVRKLESDVEELKVKVG